jgi:hypothetical protein
MSGRLFQMTGTTGRQKRPDPAYGQNFDVRGIDLAKVVSLKGPSVRSKQKNARFRAFDASGVLHTGFSARRKGLAENPGRSSLGSDNCPGLILRDRCAFLDGNDVTYLVLVVFVVRLVLLGTADRLLKQRVREAALDADNNGLLVLVGYYDALQNAFRHIVLP